MGMPLWSSSKSLFRSSSRQINVVIFGRRQLFASFAHIHSVQTEQMRLFSLLFAALIGGCIGTDFVDQPLAPAGSKAEIEPSSLSLNVDEEYPLDFRLVAVAGSELATMDWLRPLRQGKPG